MKYIYIFFLIQFAALSVTTAQRTDSLFISQDSTHILQGDTAIATRKKGPVRRFFTDDYPNPRKAALFSIIPGGGQAYNQKYWKIPIVYGVLGGLGIWQVGMTKTYKELKVNYKKKVNGEEVTQQPYAGLDAVALKRYRDEWRRYTENLWLGITIAYAMNAAEAFVDAHLSNFDTNDQLTLRPAIQNTAVGMAPAIGVGVRISLSERARK